MLHMQETPSHYPCQVQRCFSSWLLLPLQSTGLNFPLDQLLTKGLSPFLQASITPLLFLKPTKIICFFGNYASLSSSDWSITLADTDHEKLHCYWPPLEWLRRSIYRPFPRAKTSGPPILLLLNSQSANLLFHCLKFSPHFLCLHFHCLR